MFRTLTITLSIALAMAVPSALASTDQSSQAPASDMTELLAEIRKLRQAVEALVSTATRMQVLFGRLQLQEQRTVTASARLDTIRTRLNDTTERMELLSVQSKEFENLAVRTQSEDEREALSQVATQRKQELTRLESVRARLMNEEAEAAGALALEQSRWTELHEQIEELERVLGRK